MLDKLNFLTSSSIYGFIHGEKGGERKSGHANGMMVNGKYDMIMKGVGNEWRVYWNKVMMGMGDWIQWVSWGSE